MKDVRIDQDGELRCWNWGYKSFLEKRTARSKVLVGVGALMTKKKLKCQVCGEYNDTGNAKPYDGPASRKYRKQHEADGSSQTSTPRVPTPDYGTDKLAQLERLASLAASGALSDEEYAAMKTEVLAADPDANSDSYQVPPPPALTDS